MIVQNGKLLCITLHCVKIWDSSMQHKPAGPLDQQLALCLWSAEGKSVRGQPSTATSAEEIPGGQVHAGPEEPWGRKAQNVAVDGASLPPPLVRLDFLCNPNFGEFDEVGFCWSE